MTASNVFSRFFSGRNDRFPSCQICLALSLMSFAKNKESFPHSHSLLCQFPQPNSGSQSDTFHLFQFYGLFYHYYSPAVWIYYFSSRNIIQPPDNVSNTENLLNCLQLTCRKSNKAFTLMHCAYCTVTAKTSTYANQWSLDVSLAGACCIQLQAVEQVFVFAVTKATELLSSPLFEISFQSLVEILSQEFDAVRDNLRDQRLDQGADMSSKNLLRLDAYKQVKNMLVMRQHMDWAFNGRRKASLFNDGIDEENQELDGKQKIYGGVNNFSCLTTSHYSLLYLFYLPRPISLINSSLPLSFQEISNFRSSTSKKTLISPDFTCRLVIIDWSWCSFLIPISKTLRASTSENHQSSTSIPQLHLIITIPSSFHFIFPPILSCEILSRVKFLELPVKCHKTCFSLKPFRNYLECLNEKKLKKSEVSLDVLVNSCVCKSGIQPKPIWNTSLQNVKHIAIHPGTLMININLRVKFFREDMRIIWIYYERRPVLKSIYFSIPMDIKYYKYNYSTFFDLLRLFFLHSQCVKHHHQQGIETKKYFIMPQLNHMRVKDDSTMKFSPTEKMIEWNFNLIQKFILCTCLHDQNLFGGLVGLKNTSLVIPVYKCSRKRIEQNREYFREEVINNQRAGNKLF
ncbi:hypothetical protein VP01_2169g4 [Puccinia sorghi]|uniref:Uncharacterized protein n=1 Tax=Puccinia sorghi TaxID=27349 RepID=A0A0L6V9F0_9BASI|nr:hypothetical protein VP01_2169g4 [Puccinia sorghi]